MAAECWKVHYQYNRIDFVEPIEGESIGHNLSRFEKKKMILYHTTDLFIMPDSIIQTE